jgi:hypothetical protein
MSDASQDGSQAFTEPQAVPVGDADQGQGPAPEPDRDRSYSYEDMKQVREEAKRYRLRLRDAEQERATLQGRVDRHDRAAVERVAGERLAAAEDVWLVHDVADFRGEDGSLDENAVRERATELAEQRPHWRKPAGPGFDGGVRRPVAQPESFGSALKERVTGHK